MSEGVKRLQLIGWPKKILNSLLTRDVRVGGDYDENGDWDPTLGKGKSRLAVSGTLELHGEVKAPNSSFDVHHMDVGGEMRVRGDTRLDGTVRMKDSLEVDSEVKIGGRLKMSGGSTIDVNGGDVKNIQSLEVEGTTKLLNDVQIKNNTNRDYTVKLSDVLNEALDWDFKNRIDVTKMPGNTFGDQLKYAVDLTKDGDILYIPFGVYECALTETIVIENKSIGIMGCSKERPVINLTGISTLFDVSIFELPVTETHFKCMNLVINSTETTQTTQTPVFHINGGYDMPIDNVQLINSEFNAPVDFCFVKNMIIDGCTFTGCKRAVVQSSDDCSNPLENLIIKNCKMKSSNNNDDGCIYLPWNGGYDLLIQNSRIDEEFLCVRTGTLNRLTINDCEIINDSDYTPISLGTCGIVTCERTYFTGNTGIYIDFTNADSLSFIGCEFEVYGPSKPSGYSGPYSVIGCNCSNIISGYAKQSDIDIIDALLGGDS